MEISDRFKRSWTIKMDFHVHVSSPTPHISSTRFKMNTCTFLTRRPRWHGDRFWLSRPRPGQTQRPSSSTHMQGRHMYARLLPCESAYSGSSVQGHHGSHYEASPTPWPTCTLTVGSGAGSNTVLRLQIDPQSVEITPQRSNHNPNEHIYSSVQRSKKTGALKAVKWSSSEGRGGLCWSMKYMSRAPPQGAWIFTFLSRNVVFP